MLVIGGRSEVEKSTPTSVAKGCLVNVIRHASLAQETIVSIDTSAGISMASNQNSTILVVLGSNAGRVVLFSNFSALIVSKDNHDYVELHNL